MDTKRTFSHNEEQRMPADGKAHPGDDVLELYALGRLAEPALGDVEEHILVCETCQDRLDEVTDFAVTMREAAAQVLQEAEPEPEAAWRRWLRFDWLPTPAPALAGALIVLVAIAAWQPWRAETPTAWQSVSLATVRGEGAQTAAKAGLALQLQLDVAGLDPAGVSALIVSAGGAIVAEAPVTFSGTRAEVRHPAGLNAGRYWVRLKQAGETVREYSLDVR